MSYLRDSCLNVHNLITFSIAAVQLAAGIPTSLIDALLYGSIIYWFVGLAYSKGASIANYFVFLLLMLVTSTSAGLIFSIIGADVKDRTTSHACMSVCIVILILFSGLLFRRKSSHSESNLRITRVCAMS